jgi:hypothetical protein
LEGAERFTRNVSFGSTTASPFTGTVKVSVVSSGRKVTVAVVDV